MVQEPDVWVVFAAVKGDAADTIVQKATELGASQIMPVITQRVSSALSSHVVPGPDMVDAASRPSSKPCAAKDSA